MVVGLAVMKLVAAGELSLQDRLADLAPEVEFDNPWEQQHPVRVIHLLNHTTGWDAPHGPELAGQQGKPLDIASALALHPQSRHSRWVPGSRSAYNNTGPLVAAYIVEKISGMRFEDFVQTRFFDPLAMQSSGYYFDDQYRSNAANLYRGREALPYWHLPNRAAGGMHSSLEDMIRFVHFMQRPDEVVNGDILAGDVIRAMELPSGSDAAAAGLEVDWGAGLTSFHHKGMVFYGLEGALPGARALVAYQPGGRQGHIVLTNGNTPAAGRIHELLSDYSTAELGAAPVHVTAADGHPEASLAGFYRIISPVAERFRIATRLMPWKMTVGEHSVELSPVIGGKPRKLRVTEDGNFVQPDTGRVALVRTEDPLAGNVLHYGPMTLKKTGAVTAMAPLLLLVIWLIAILLGAVFLLFWLPRHLFGRALSRADARLRRWSLLPLLGLLMVALGGWLAIRSSEPYAATATISLPSLLIFAGSIVFLLAAWWGLWIWKRCGTGAQPGFWRGHATTLIFLNVAVSTYLLSYGLIGLRLWA